MILKATITWFDKKSNTIFRIVLDFIEKMCYVFKPKTEVLQCLLEEKLN